MIPTVTFTVTTGPMQGRQLTFAQRTFLSVGRAAECLLCLGEGADTTVSRRHCVFDIAPPEVVVRDLGSLNGTYVNGVRIGGRDELGQPRVGSPTHLTLYHGDTVRVGGTCFRVTIHEGRACHEPSPAGTGVADATLADQGSLELSQLADVGAGV